MTSTTTMLRTSGRALAIRSALAAALLAAFVLAPPKLAGDPTGSFRGAFVGYWRTGERDFTPDLDRVVDSWFRYHLAKAVIAALLLAVLVALGTALWRVFLRGAGRRVAVASAGAAVTVLALFALAVVMANVQGAAAPFASLLPTLVDGPADPELAGTLDQIRHALASSTTDDPPRPALDVIIDDYAHYHAVMAVIAATVTAVLAALSVATWRRFVRIPSSATGTRRAVASFGALSALATLAVIVVAVANTTVAADPLPGLTGFFNGGW